jgi:protein-S-isoprenylcysteine O-methyltransferase Ste14
MSVKIGLFFFRHRHLLYVPFVLVIFLFDKPYNAFMKPYENPMVIWPVGSGFLLLGVILRFFGIRYCGKRTVYKREEGKWLTLTGPYSHMRNPLYHSNLLIGCGLIAIGKLFWLIPIFVVVGYIYYHFVVLYEESRLSMQFGEKYADFCKNVPRWIPRLTSYRAGEGELKLNPWSEVFGAEKWRFLAVAVIVGLISCKDYFMV